MVRDVALRTVGDDLGDADLVVVPVPEHVGPHRLEQFVFADGPGSIRDEDDQQLKCLEREVHQLAISIQLPRTDVEVKPAELEHLRRLDRWTRSGNVVCHGAH